MDRTGLLGMAGGLLGIASVFMPWLVLTAVLVTRVDVGLSGFQVVLEVIQGLVRAGQAGEEVTFLPTDPGAQLFVLGLSGMTAGVLIFLVGSALSLARPEGGYVMVGAAVISATAVSLMSVGAQEALGTTSLLLGVGYGLFVGFVASGVVLAGKFLGASSQVAHDESA